MPGCSGLCRVRTGCGGRPVVSPCAVWPSCGPIDGTMPEKKWESLEELEAWDRERRLSAEKAHADWNAEIRRVGKDRQDIAGRNGKAMPVLGLDVLGVHGSGLVVTGITRKHDGGPVWCPCSWSASRPSPSASPG